MRNLFALLVCLGLAACGRPLTEAEAAYMADLQGDGFDASAVRIAREPRDRAGHPHLPGAAPDHLPRAHLAAARWPDDRGAHRRHRALQHHARAPRILLPDYVAPREGRRSLAAAMFFAHEMTHVWQWQNRGLTAYHPFRAFSEHVRIEDPYLFDPQDARRFLDYGYEVQASLVEEYVCCRAVDPRGARTARLERLIGQVMPVTPLQSRADAVTEVIPWDGADLRGVCS
jgi:hypothetical protein